MKQLFRSKEAGILLIIILVSAVITLKNPVFLTTENLLDLAKNNTVIGIVALGMLPVIITGELMSRWGRPPQSPSSLASTW